MNSRLGIFLSLFLLLVSCAQERPYLAGHIRRAHDAVMVSCDPYNLGRAHTCLVFSAAFRPSLYAYDATTGEMVLAPMSYFPLKIKVGPSTNELVQVISSDANFPLMFALDHQQASLYPIRLFANESERSFSEPKPERLTKSPYRMAMLDVAGKIIGLLTHPDDGSLEIMAFERNTGKIHPSIVAKKIKIGTKPSDITIDAEGKFAVIADQKESNLHVLNLSNIDDVLTKGAAHTVSTIAMSWPVERPILAKRDFGAGLELYGLVLSASNYDVSLVNIGQKKLEGNITMPEFPKAAYLPDEKCSTCCGGKKQWLSVVTIKGKLIYVTIDREGTALKFEKSTPTELTSESNLALGTIVMNKVLGGAILQDSTLDQEPLCSSHRQTFYISSYGSSRTYLHTEPVEVEAHGYSCEGEASATRFGYKSN